MVLQWGSPVQFNLGLWWLQEANWLIWVLHRTQDVSSLRFPIVTQGSFIPLRTLCLISSVSQSLLPPCSLLIAHFQPK